jgi:hypothetical protein
MLATDHLFDKAQFGTRDRRSKVMWVKRPMIGGAKAPDLLENKGIYRAEVRAES